MRRFSSNQDSCSICVSECRETLSEEFVIDRRRKHKRRWRHTQKQSFPTVIISSGLHKCEARQGVVSRVWWQPFHNVRFSTLCFVPHVVLCGGTKKESVVRTVYQFTSHGLVPKKFRFLRSHLCEICTI
jgi:hypothetical protein